MKRDLKAIGRKIRVIAVTVDGTGTASVDGGMSNQVTLTDNGTGDYTLTYDVPFAVAPVIMITPITASISPRIKTNTFSALTIECEDNDGTPTPTDADFHVVIIGTDSADGFSF